jgi:hypothetical protein
VARRRQTALALNLKQFLRPRYHGPRWIAEQFALLGTMSDAEVAARLGRMPGAVRLMRCYLGIPSVADRRRREFR